MLKIHTADGKTTRIDLRDGEQAKWFLGQLKRSEFQRTVTGVSVVQDATSKARCPSCNCANELSCGKCGKRHAEIRTTTGVQYSLTRPEDVEPVFYQVEQVEVEGSRGGARVTCFAGEARIVMMVHRGQPSVRVTLSNPGRQRYNPIQSG
jgi:hypothetical protein